MQSNMKKHYILLSIVLVLLATVTVLSVYKYNQQPKGITLSQAVKQRDTALTSLKLQKELNANDEQAVTNLTADKRALISVNATLCTQIKAAKLIQPLCK